MQILHCPAWQSAILHYSIFRGANMGELKSLRIERKLTQNQAADILGVSLRSYKSYEMMKKGR